MNVKKFFSTILSVSMVFSSFSFYGLTNPYSLFTLKVEAADIIKNGKCGDNANYSFDSSNGVLTISGTGDMTDYSALDSSPWADYSIKSLIIQEGITSIGDFAFYSLHNIKDITIPDTVTKIGAAAFDRCKSLTSISLPENVTLIGGSAFAECSNLESIIIPKSVKAIGGSAFNDTPWLISKRKDSALVIINNILIDGRNCQGDIIIPDGVTSISGGAFEKCIDLKTITLPDSIIDMGTNVFYGCSSLTKVKLSKNLKTLPDSTFRCCSSLEEVSIPNTLEIVETTAFFECNSLKEISLPNTVTKIGDAAFYKCSTLESISIPEGVTAIESSTFYECKNLKKVLLPSTINEIGRYAFERCFQLEVISIPENVTSIGSKAFENTAWLSQKRQEEDFVIINGILLYGVTNNKKQNIVIPNNVHTIGGYAFSSRYEDLKSVVIPEGVTRIEEEAFSFSELKEMYIPKSVNYIGRGAFGFCPKLDRIIIDNPDCEIYDELLTICNNNHDDYFGSCFFKGTIKGHKNSTAEAFAKKYQLNFISIEDEPIITTTTTTTNTPTTTTTTVTTTATKSTTTTTISNKEEFKLSVTSVSLNNGNQYVIPLNYSDVTYKSTNTDVAIVSPKGIVTAVGEGEAIINIIDKDYNVIQLKIAVKSANSSPDDYKFGDVNGDNQINAVDASAVLAYYAMISTNKDGNFNESQKAAADVNGDGQINAVDASNILAYYAYLSTTKEDILSLKEYMKKE